MLEKKSSMAIRLFEKNENNFICPICNGNLKASSGSVVCENNHTFNVSKKGSLVLYKTSKLKNDKIYTKALFENRRKFILEGFYKKVHQLIAKEINLYAPKIILDMGCGEGTHDIIIKRQILDNPLFLGIDLSKEGIDLSNDYLNENFIGLVSDLNNLPLKEKSIDLILNILSPSNESEMNRVLSDNGIIIKVTPKKEYLQEIREALKLSDYKNEITMNNNIIDNYQIIDKLELNDTYELSKESLKYLSEMTPLMANQKSIPNISEITIALNIYVLKPKKGDNNGLS